jgi:aspartyl-tRNA(Asn)/glutamyl-tRNA(Gln) amidotransferase subunit A
MYTYSTITAVSQALRTKEVSATALVNSCLQRIDQLNPTLNAFITVMRDEALQQAQIADAEIAMGNWKGPLHGIPVAVKDFYDTAGTRTTAAFEHFQNRVPKKDAVVVTKLKEAGAIIIGKTNMDQLGMGTTSLTGYYGPVHNPLNGEYVAGGSSGGSAAAIAAGLCYGTVDTDAIGSCRLPAACCGVTGFKASYRLIDMEGILAGEKADEAILLLSQAGLMTRSVEDTAILLNALADPAMTKSPFKDDYRHALGANKALRIGVVKNFKATDAVKISFYNAVKVFKDLGYATKEIAVPFDRASFDIQHIAADRREIGEQLFKMVDILLLPVMTDLVPLVTNAAKGGPQALAPDNTLFCNYLGLPAVSIPCGPDIHGLPTALQIAGPWQGEGNVLDAAFSFQQATPWSSRQGQ